MYSNIIKIFVLILFSANSENFKRSCKDFKYYEQFLCDDSEGLLVLVHGQSFSDSRRIQFEWFKTTLQIKCFEQEIKTPYLFTFDFQTKNVIFNGCYLRESIIKFFPNLNNSKVYEFWLKSEIKMSEELFENITTIKELRIQKITDMSYNHITSLTYSFKWFENLDILQVEEIAASIFLLETCKLIFKFIYFI